MSARAAIAACCVLAAGAACADAPATSRCGRAAFVDDGSVVAPAFGLGGGIWYDPGDDWWPGDPVDDSSDYDDGAAGDGYDDTGDDDGTTDDGTGASDDTGGDDTGGDDTGGDDTGGDVSTDSLRSARPAPGCFVCTLACTTDGATARIARAGSEASDDAACASAAAALEGWAHARLHAHVTSCARVADAAPTPATPATPVVAPPAGSSGEPPARSMAPARRAR